MAGQAHLFKSTVNEYLESLSETVHSKLYKSPATCLAIFRLLPSLSKFYVMTLLFNEDSTSYANLNRWLKVPPTSSKAHPHITPTKLYQNECLKRLKALNLIKDVRKTVTHPTTGKSTTVVLFQLNPIFRASFRDAVTGGGSASAFGDASDRVESKRDDLQTMFSDNVTIDYLDSYSLMKWENILHFMVGTELLSSPSVGVLSLLRHSGLMELEADREAKTEAKTESSSTMTQYSLNTLKNMKITNEGFQFLLQDINSQIWTLLLEYLKMSEKLMMDPVEVLNFIFMLGSLELGKGYPTAMLSDTQIIMLEDLVDYGLIYYPKPVEPESVSMDVDEGPEGETLEQNERDDVVANRLFYPTRLATTLTSDSMTFKSASTAMTQATAEADSGSGKDMGNVILETNFKLYCYTTSPLQVAILNLFVHLKSRFSNMVTGAITRESIRKALTNGITAEQIIKYLESHAHSQMKKLAEERLVKKLDFENSTNSASDAADTVLEVLPPTVVDQIKLWQLELDRIQTFQGYLFKDFVNDQEFELLSTYGEEVGILLWKDVQSRRFFVTQEGNKQLIDYAARALRRQKQNGERAATPL
ncbi:unnamed protein product [Kuraishia capsulata CBS 1993]|uniref:RNA polymerase II transcription factor B subunit 2 n=1 Tax=Kuraishia capsulata CBS 1993 TaxID=1382522 RepID=W6MXA2_9ASCO|nr:uncharacterized protein KUCA_T00004518001 [Kuraishia capsulata CBS 1993]CDK28535.1 unnamed protein product [Kuraishia capsulata CBS 1993]